MNVHCVVRAKPHCHAEPCVICREPVYACELGDCPEGSAHVSGGQLRSGLWVCSQRCHDVAEEWPRPVTLSLVAHRILALLAMGPVILSVLTPSMEWRAALALTGISVAVFGLVLLLVERPGPEPQGSVTSRGRWRR